MNRRARDEAQHAMDLMARASVNQLPVTENGKVGGLVARDGIIRFLRMRSNVGALP